MEKDEFEERLEAKTPPGIGADKLRTPVTILFTDIKGSTAYFEKHGDVAGMVWMQHHNDLLFPIVEQNGGRVVKTIGDAIMACFDQPLGAIKAGAGMQRALAHDREGKPQGEQIHIRVGIHTGLGLVQDNDVFGDVVNAAARVQRQTEPDQILITEFLLDAARAAGFQCANFGTASMRGKDEPIEIYAVAWSTAATEELVDAIQARFEAKLKEAKRRNIEVEEEFDNAREQWRTERRKLNADLQELEETLERTLHVHAPDDLQSDLQFQLEDGIRARQDLQREMEAAQAKWNSERNNLKVQIASMQGSVIDAMERSNNPSRMALAVREQVEAQLADKRLEWEAKWEGERRRLTAEVDRLKKTLGAAAEKKEAARRALLERLGKLPAGPTVSAAKTADEWESEFEDARIQWNTERDQLLLKIQQLANELRHIHDVMRLEVHHEVRGQFEVKLAEANRERQSLGLEVEALNSQLNDERQRLNARIAALEQAIPEARVTLRKQLTAELQAQFDVKLEESNRLKSRSERKLHDMTEELEADRRRVRRQVALLEEQLKEARGAALKAQRQPR